MNRREAKREACFRAAQLIRSALDSGWPDEHYDGPEGPDTELVIDELQDLGLELDRRGWKARSNPDRDC